MAIETVTADSRFDTTEFSTEIIDGQSGPLTTTYTCPVCSERIGFSKEHFDRRAERQASNLPPDTQRLFSDWASQNGEAGNRFLDWQCPGCGLAARVYARFWAGGRHGDSGVVLSVVLETSL